MDTCVDLQKHRRQSRRTGISLATAANWAAAWLRKSVVEGLFSAIVTCLVTYPRDVSHAISCLLKLFSSQIPNVVLE